MEKQIEVHNPWRKNPFWKQEGVKRILFEKLLKSLENELITVLKGPRQSGKTYLARQIVSALLEKGTPPANIFYFLFDDPDLLSYVEEHPSEFLKYIISESEKCGKLYVFLDEFQKVKELSSLVKNLFEAQVAVKFILLGSSSLLISEKVSESLFGRTETFILYPFSFGEYLTYKNVKIPQLELQAILKALFFETESAFDRLNEFYQQYHFIFTQTVESLLQVYLLTGGYPRAALAENTENAFLRLKEIKQAYIEKDLLGLLKIGKIRDFEKTITRLALQTGNLINYAGLQRDIGISFQTMKKFINILEGTYFVSLCPNFTTSKITSLKKMPKTFFYDNGLRNFFSSTLEQTSAAKEKGALSENLVFSQLAKFNAWHLNDLGKIQFWRSPSGNEIDFVFSYQKHLLPIEVKLSQPPGRGVSEFLKRLDLDRIIIINQDKLWMKKRDNRHFVFLPLSLFALGLS